MTLLRAKSYLKNVVWRRFMRPMLAVLFIIVFAFSISLLQTDSSLADTDTQTLVPNTDYGTTNDWGYDSGSSDGTCAGGTHCDFVDNNTETDYLATGTDSAAAAEEEFDFTDITYTGTLDSIDSVSVRVRAGVNGSCLGGGGANCDGLDMQLYIDGAYNGTLKSVANLTTTMTTYTVTWGGLSDTTASDLRVEIVRNKNGTGKGTSSDDDIRMEFVEAIVDFTFTPPAPAATYSLLTQQDYVFENDDGSVDSGGVATDGATFANNGCGGNNWTSPGNAQTSDDVDASITLAASNISSCLRSTNFGFSVPNDATIIGIEVVYESASTSALKMKDNDVYIVKGGTQSGTNKSLALGGWGNTDSLTTYGSSTDLWGVTWTPSDINSSNFGVERSVLNTDTVSQTAYIDHVTIAVYYSSTASTALAGSLFSSPTTLVDARVGERVNLRMHIKNTGDGAIDTTDELALFYDRNDGIWTKVKTNVEANTATGDCTNTDWDCLAVDVTGTVGTYTSMAIDSLGNPWVSYYDTTSASLSVAQYVGGTSGTGCAGGSTAWTCTAVDVTDNVGQYTSIAFDSSGKAWVSYLDLTNKYLMVAQYVGGTSGTGCNGGSTAWTCESVKQESGPGSSILYTSISVDSSGTVWVAYYAGTITAGLSPRVVSRDGGGSGNCDDTDWNCETIYNPDTGLYGLYPSIAFDANDVPWISFYDSTNFSLMITSRDGGGSGSCTNTDWNCTTIDLTDDVGKYTSIAFDPSGTAWISYFDETGDNLMVAKYVGGTSGTGCDGGSTAWTCTAVDVTDIVGWDTSIAFDPSGNAWISYTDGTNRNLEVAKYVDSGGNCDTVGAGSDAWTCTTVDNTDDYGTDTSIAFDPSGVAWVSYNDGTEFNLRVANITRGGEISVTPSLPLVGGDSLTTSRADMTSASDTTNRDNANCITGSATWNNGTYFESENGTGLSLPIGDVTAQCTEISWTLDTSQATPGTTYRFVVASKDAWRADKGQWRGPIAIEEYPTITIRDDYTNRFAKDAFFEMANCTDTDWGCDTIISDGTSGIDTNIAIDPAGNPWITYTESGSDNIWVARYVGSGGDCDDVSGSDAWDCTLVDASDTQQVYPSIAFAPDGTAWISYHGAGADLEVARYVGSGGTGCTSTAWTCTEIETTNLNGGYSSLAIDKNGNPWVSFSSVAGATCDDSPTDECSLKVARYVGSGGTGCTSGTTEWSCEVIDNPTSTNSVGSYTSIAIDSYGNPWISYYDITNTNLKLAQYVGLGGTGCTGSSTTWTCITVDSADTGEDGEGGTSLAFDAAGNAWISYQARPSATLYGLKVTTNKTSPGFGAACTASGWTCGEVDDSARAIGRYSSIAFAADGVDPWISTWLEDSGGDSCNDSPTNECSLVVAKLVGSGGSSPCKVEWQCSIIDNPSSTNSVGLHTSIAFDNSGSAWVSYYDNTNGAIKVAKLHLPPTAPSAGITNTPSSRNARSGDARYRLTTGSGTIDTQPACSTVADYEGYCGIREDDGNYDSIVADASERSLFTGAFYSFQNTELPTFIWRGNSDLPPNTAIPASTAGDLGLEVYRFGTTNAWESLDTDTISSNCDTAQCNLSGAPSGTPSEYYESDGSAYWIYTRVYQKAGSASYTFKTDSLQRSQVLSFLRHGAVFEDKVLSPFRF